MSKLRKGRVFMKIIYEKKYPPEEEGDKLIPPEEILPAFAEAFSHLSFRYMPEREEGKEAFIQKAIEFSEKYKYDIKISEARLSVKAELSFDHQYNLGDFTRLIGMADDITIRSGVNGREFSVSLLYYIHAVLRDGNVVIP